MPQQHSNNDDNDDDDDDDDDDNDDNDDDDNDDDDDDDDQRSKVCCCAGSGVSTSANTDERVYKTLACRVVAVVAGADSLCPQVQTDDRRWLRRHDARRPTNEA